MSDLGICSHIQSPPWFWQETDINLLESPVSSQATPSTTSVGSFQKLNASSASNSPASATTTSTQRISKLDRAFLMKKLRWSRSTDVAGSSGHHAGLTTSSSPFSPTCMAASSSSSSTTVIVTENTPIGLTLVTDDVATTEQADHSMIANLCSKIATSEDLSSFGYLKEEALEYSVKPLFKASKQPQVHISLNELLKGSTKPTRAQRYNIALILVSSFTQLHPTP